MFTVFFVVEIVIMGLLILGLVGNALIAFILYKCGKNYTFFKVMAIIFLIPFIILFILCV